MEEKAKSVILGRKKVKDGVYNSIITLFEINDPHLSTDMPKKTIELDCTKISFSTPIKFDFLALGNDVVINNISSISIEENGEEAIIKIVQD